MDKIKDKIKENANKAEKMAIDLFYEKLIKDPDGIYKPRYFFDDQFSHWDGDLGESKYGRIGLISLEIKDRRESKALYELIEDEGGFIDENKVINCLDKYDRLIFLFIFYSRENPISRLKETIYCFDINKHYKTKYKVQERSTQKSSWNKSRELNRVLLLPLESAFKKFLIED